MVTGVENSEKKTKKILVQGKEGERARKRDWRVAG